MNMKEHILSALREQFVHLDNLLVTLNEEQVTIPHQPSQWSTKDEVAHLWAWQQRSIARLQTAQTNKAPEYPSWAAEVDPEVNDNTDQINDWIYQAYRLRQWKEVYSDWNAGFLRFLELAEKISEKDLLDADKFPWLKGHSLAVTLLSSYDHHQEHYDGTRAWMRQDK